MTDKRPLPPRETSPAAKSEEKRMFSQAKLKTDDAKDVSFLHLCNCVSWNMFTSGDAFRDFNLKHLHSCFFFFVIMVCDGFMPNTRGVDQGK